MSPIPAFTGATKVDISSERKNRRRQVDSKSVKRSSRENTSEITPGITIFPAFHTNIL